MTWRGCWQITQLVSHQQYYDELRNDSFWPFNPQKWLTCSFPLEYPYIIQQTGNENIQTYQVKVFILVWHQILATTPQGNVISYSGELTIGSWELTPSILPPWFYYSFNYEGVKLNFKRFILENNHASLS